MILGFKKKFPFGSHEPTNFEEKILRGIKIHTLREDLKGRWLPKCKIEMATGVRTKHYKQFNAERPDLQQKISTQEVRLVYKYGVSIWVDNHELRGDAYQKFIINDGFDSYLDFLQFFFPKHLAGIKEEKNLRLIHWTDMRYLPYAEQTADPCD